MKTKLHIALNNEIYNDTQFGNTLINYIKLDIPTQRFVFLPADRDKNGLLFTKRLHMMILGYWLFICKDHYEQF